MLVALATGCDLNDTSLEVYHRRTVDFEGEAWSGVIATLPSSFDFMTADYVWEDGETSLTSRPKFTTSEWGSYYGGGCTVSNYGTNNLAEMGSFLYDLYVYSATADATSGCGAEGSNNFLVLYGNYDQSIEGEVDCRPEIYFRDGKPRTIESCQVNTTVYFVNVVENGNAFSPALGENDDDVVIYATGIDAEGNTTATAEFTLASYGLTVKQWASWDLSSLGKVVKVRFNILGGPSDEYGMTTPKYFALDNIRVRWQE